MAQRTLKTMAGLALVAVAAWALAPHAAAQAPKPAAKAKTYVAPRTADGHPDLQGTYNVATLTPLERPAGVKEFISDEEAAVREQQIADRVARTSRPSDPNRTAPPVGGDGSTGAAGNVGGYNAFWLDRGTRVASLDGQRRTSIVVDPPDGRVPPMLPEARQRNATRAFRPSSDAPETTIGVGVGAFDDPERRPLGERCILGFGSTAGPPALPVLYNNLKQVVQSRDRVVIMNEMNHDARVIRIGGKHLPPTLRQWMGDSIGHWEGDTLVVDTTNFTEKTRFRGSSPELHVIERFTRTGPDTLRYEFTVDDPSTWAKPWRGEYPWVATDEKLYEYACHEGNYSLTDILKGARLQEAEAAAKNGR